MDEEDEASHGWSAGRRSMEGAGGRKSEKLDCFLSLWFLLPLREYGQVTKGA